MKEVVEIKPREIKANNSRELGICLRLLEGSDIKSVVETEVDEKRVKAHYIVRFNTKDKKYEELLRTYLLLIH